MVNDPASMRTPVFAYDEAGKASARRTWVDWGDHILSTRVARRFRDNVFGGNYQDYVGGHYHVMEIFSTRVLKADLAKVDAGERVPYTSTWTRISPWLPWMKMAGRDGTIVLATNGRSFDRVADIPEPINSAVRDRWPLMKETPAFDDTRPFVNSWASMKAEIDAREDD